MEAQTAMHNTYIGVQNESQKCAFTPLTGTKVKIGWKIITNLYIQYSLQTIVYNVPIMHRPNDLDGIWSCIFIRTSVT